ncbi:hypothetical protein DFJ74DRAFT_228342 [Hyaloraphidium curvatum]|nr:hypothetical protein DFJ74DRAFT_228342 [Hyaloraphidium curvatum]
MPPPVEMISATFKAGDYQVVFGALEPLLIREAATLPASVDADAEVSRESILGLPASDSVLLLELMMKSAEAANKPPHIVSEIGAKEFEALVLHLAASSSTLDVLEKLDSLLHRLKLAWQRGDPSHWGRASITAFFRATFQATMLAHEMLVRWSEFVPLAQRPSPERERLRNLCHLFVVRTMQLVTQAGLYHRGSNSHEVAEFLLFTHQLLGARDLCGADNGSFLEQCREIFSNAGPSYKHAKIQIYNCLYDVVLDPEVPFQRHATQARSLDKHVSEIALAIAPRWASNLQRDRPNERVRHTMSATLDRLISAVGDHWERNGETRQDARGEVSLQLLHPSSGHVQRNRNLLERVLSSDCKIEPASARHSFPWHDASTLAAACDSIPAACFHVFYLKGTLMFPQYDATKSQYTEHAVVLEDVVLPCFLKNLELNCDSLEAWWCLGLCYAHLAWNALGQESGSVLRSRRKDVASWQRRAFHCLTHALYGIKDSPQALIFRAPSFPFHPKSSSAASDLLSSLGCLIMSMICSPMEGLALQPACTSVMPCADQQEEDVQGISLAKEETLRQRFLTFAVALLRQCASRQREEWQLPYMIAQSLRKLDAAPALILGFFREGLALQPPMTLTRGKAPLLDCRLEILSYLGKDSDRGRISKAEALSAITALPGEHAHVDDSQPSLVNVVLQELYQLKRLDPEGWHVKIPYNIAWLQWHKLADPEAAKATLNSIFGANHRLKVWKSGAARPGDVLATRQAIYALLLDVLQGANDMDGIRSLLSRIGRDRSSKDLFMEETTDPDSIWRTAFAAVFEHVRAQDVLGKELVPVNPGMSTALGAKLSRAEFDRLAPRVEDRMLVLARRSGQDLASRRLNLLQKLEELRKWRDAWQWGRSVLIVDTDEDSDLERMAVGIYGWLWRTAIVDGEMSVFSNDGSGQAKEEQRTNDPKLRFKHVSRRVQLFVRGLPHARTIAPSKDKQDQDAAQGPLSSGDGPREPSMFGVTPSHGPRSPTAAL